MAPSPPVPVEDISLLMYLKMKAVEVYLWVRQTDFVPDDLEPVFLVLLVINVALVFEVQAYRGEKRTVQEGAERWGIRIARIWRRRWRRVARSMQI